MKTLTTLGLIALLSVQEYPVVYYEIPLNNILMVYADQPREIPMCQFGYVQNNIRFVTNVKLPYVMESTEEMADFYRPHCDVPNYLGIIHNHNNGICIPSEVDLERFVNDEKASIESIVCFANVEQNRIRMNHFMKSEIPDSIIRRYKRDEKIK